MSMGKTLSWAAPRHRLGLTAFVAMAAILPPSLAGESAPSRTTTWLEAILPIGSASTPRFVFTAITEFTDAGRKHRAVSPASPEYYLMHSLGYQTRGSAVRETELPRAELEPVLVDSLAQNGFKPSTSANPPSIVVFYMWGAHNPIERDEPDSETYRNSLDRAALAGGTQFAKRLARAYSDTQDMFLASPKMVSEDGITYGAGIQLGMTQLNRQMNPLQTFRFNLNNERLLNHASDNCYFVVVSAYDYALLAKNQRQLLWRTRLTVSARGASQQTALPSLVSYSARYFGHEMKEAEIVRMPRIPTGSVKVGTPEVVR